MSACDFKGWTSDRSVGARDHKKLAVACQNSYEVTSPDVARNCTRPTCTSVGETKTATGCRFAFVTRPHQVRCSPILHSEGNSNILSARKAAEAWSTWLISNICWSRFYMQRPVRQADFTHFAVSTIKFIISPCHKPVQNQLISQQSKVSCLK